MSRPALWLAAAAALMLFFAAGNSLVVVPDLHGDLVELGVRPTVLGGTVLALHFGVLANFAFTAIVGFAAFQASRGIAPNAIPLVIVAIVYAALGAMALSRSHSPHHLGPIAMAALILMGVLSTRRSSNGSIGR